MFFSRPCANTGILMAFLLCFQCGFFAYHFRRSIERKKSYSKPLSLPTLTTILGKIHFRIFWFCGSNEFVSKIQRQIRSKKHTLTVSDLTHGSFRKKERRLETNLVLSQFSENRWPAGREGRSTIHRFICTT